MWTSQSAHATIINDCTTLITNCTIHSGNGIDTITHDIAVGVYNVAFSAPQFPSPPDCVVTPVVSGGPDFVFCYMLYTNNTSAGIACVTFQTVHDSGTGGDDISGSTGADTAFSIICSH